MRGNGLHAPPLIHSWLVFIAVIPQLLVFQIPATGKWVPLFWVKAILIGSQALLLGFVWSNRKSPGVWLLGLGLGLNVLVILINGGLMPISPEAASRVYPATPPQAWTIGNRLGLGKDILLAESETRLGILSDRFHLPAWFPYRAAFSVGDILIAFGVFQLFWSAGRISEDDQIKRFS